MRISIELTAIELDIERNWRQSLRQSFQMAGRTIAEDDLEQPIQVTMPEPEIPEGMYFPVTVYDDEIREYYPRQKSERTGTRIVFKNGSARPVKESYEEVKAKLRVASNAARRGSSRSRNSAGDEQATEAGEQ